MEYALFLILNKVDELENVQKILYDNGCGCTTIDSTGMGKVLLSENVDIPIYAGLRKLVEGNRPYNKTIISIIRTEEKLRVVIDDLKKALGIEDSSIAGGIGFIFVMPVMETHGYRVIEKNKK